MNVAVSLPTVKSWFTKSSGLKKKCIQNSVFHEIPENLLHMQYLFTLIMHTPEMMFLSFSNWIGSYI